MLALVCFLLAVMGGPARAQYAATPFRVEAIEATRALAESVSVTNWLNANFQSLDDRQRQGVREHIHALIDVQVKLAYAKHGSFRLPDRSHLLGSLYSWAGRLGIYGSDLVSGAVQGPDPMFRTVAPRPPAGLELGLFGPSLVLASTEGQWQARMPFHFFIFRLNAGPDAAGRRREVAVLSTGTAPDAAPPGYSQATIALIFVHGEADPAFEQNWAQHFRVPMSAPLQPVEATGYHSRIHRATPGRLFTELVHARTMRGDMAIVYSGLDGTYQANRPHFIDFLRLLTLPPRQ